MIKYNTLNLKKNSTLFISGQISNNKFYIIKKGKIIFESYFADNYTYEHKKGDIIGIVSAIINEPYFSTAKVTEDIEILEINTKEIEKIDNIFLMNKIYFHLVTIMELWIKKYYDILSMYTKIERENKLDKEKVAKAYIDRGFTDAALKIHKTSQFISKINTIEEPAEITKGIFNYKKGSCIFSELNPNNHIYIIKSGVVGVYSYFNGKVLTRMIYSDNDIFGYKDLLGKKLINTTAVVLEDAIIKVLDKKEFDNMIHTDKAVRMYLIKIMSLRVHNTISRIKAININNIRLKILTVIEALVKLELMFKRTNYISLLYTIDDILTMVFLNYNDYIEREIKKIKSIKITNNRNIIINNVNNFFKEYERYKKIYSENIIEEN